MKCVLQESNLVRSSEKKYQSLLNICKLSLKKYIEVLLQTVELAKFNTH